MMRWNLILSRLTIERLSGSQVEGQVEVEIRERNNLETGRVALQQGYFESEIIR